MDFIFNLGFKRYIENPLGKYLKAKILKANESRIEKVDEIVFSLIKSRYSNLDEYKDKIIKGHKLPSYVRNLLTDNGFWNVDATSIDSLINSANNKKHLNISSFLNSSAFVSNSNASNDEDDSTSTSSNSSGICQPFYSSSKTNDYLKELKKSTKINNHLDHISFDSNGKDVIARNGSVSSSTGASTESTSSSSSTTGVPVSLITPIESEATTGVNESNSSSASSPSSVLSNNAGTNGNIKSEKQQFIDDMVLFDPNNSNYLMESNENNLENINKLMNNPNELLKDIFEANQALLANYSPSKNILFELKQQEKLAAQLRLASAKANPLNLNTNNGSQNYLFNNNMNDFMNNDGSIFDDYSNVSNECLNYHQFLNNKNLAQESAEEQLIANSPMYSSAISKQIGNNYNLMQQANKILMNTPKTPNNLNQYSDDKQSDLQNSASLWSSVQQQNMLNRALNSGGNLMSRQNLSTMTPPPSATIKTSALSVLTNRQQMQSYQNQQNLDLNGTVDDAFLFSASSSASSPHLKPTLQGSKQFNQYDQQLTINSSSFNEDQLAKYLKHSAYISSPGSNRMAPSLMLNNSSNYIGSKLANNNSNYEYNNNYMNGFNLNMYSPPAKLNSSLSSAQTVGNKLINKNGNDLSSFSNYSNYRSQQQHQQQQQQNQRYGSTVDLSLNRQNDYLTIQDINNLSNCSSAKSPLTKSPPGLNCFASQHQQQQQQSYMMNNSNNNSNYYIWSGRLPPKIYAENSLYSRKVFLGGLPWDVNHQLLLQLLSKYGSVKLEVPGKDQKHPRVSNINKTQERSTPGYVYIIYESESSVQRMLADCRKEIKNGGEHYFYTIIIPVTNVTNNGGLNTNMVSGKRTKAKEVEVIPWNQEDTSYVPQNKAASLPSKIDSRTTIFVGALHGMLNAHGLAKVMNESFGEVIHAGLDTDKYKYPIGSGRVTFRNRQSYVKAIKARFISIRANLEPSDPSPKFEKTIQMDPYLEDAKCSKCDNKSYYFCRNEICLDYYCTQCWTYRHDTKTNGEHLSLTRQNKPNHG